MNTSFSDLISMMKSVSIDNFIGYSEAEIKKIERLYDIKATDDFKQFLLIAGRSAGGAIGDYEVIFYHQQRVRGHLLFQEGLREELRQLGLNELSAMRPFFVSVEGETDFYFFKTWDTEDERFYVYDEDNDKVRKTDFTFVSYMQRQVSRELGLRAMKRNNPYSFSPEIVVCRGDLLEI